MFRVADAVLGRFTGREIERAQGSWRRVQPLSGLVAT